MENREGELRDWQCGSMGGDGCLVPGMWQAMGRGRWLGQPMLKCHCPMDCNSCAVQKIKMQQAMWPIGEKAHMEPSLVTAG